MGDTVAVTAFREAFVHGLGMRHAMAVVACADIRVLAGMTGHTVDMAMLGLACGKRRKSAVVAGGTQRGRRVCRICHGQRHVRLVAGCAVCLGHRR